jgi:hypothetical protein
MSEKPEHRIIEQQVIGKDGKITKFKTRLLKGGETSDHNIRAKFRKKTPAGSPTK